MTTYALCLGVNTYVDGAFTRLEGAENDAERLSELFESRLQFKSEALIGDKCAGVFDKLRSYSKDLQPNDIFIFYFSGHGWSAEDDQYYLLPHCPWHILDKGGRVADEAISYKHLITSTSGPKWRQVTRIFIMDACRSALLRDKGVGPESFKGEFLLRLAAGPRKQQESDGMDDAPFVLFHSCDIGESAVELPKIKHGAFTKSLLNYFDEALLQGRELVFNQGLADEVRDKMGTLLATHGVHSAQKPVLIGGPVGLQMKAYFSREERGWQTALLGDTIQSYLTFIDNFPNSRHTEEAQQRYQKLVQTAPQPGSANDPRSVMALISSLNSDLEREQRERENVEAAFAQFRDETARMVAEQTAQHASERETWQLERDELFWRLRQEENNLVEMEKEWDEKLQSMIAELTELQALPQELAEQKQRFAELENQLILMHAAWLNERNGLVADWERKYRRAIQKLGEAEIAKKRFENLNAVLNKDAIEAQQAMRDKESQLKKVTGDFKCRIEGFSQEIDFLKNMVMKGQELLHAKDADLQAGEMQRRMLVEKLESINIKFDAMVGEYKKSISDNLELKNLLSKMGSESEQYISTLIANGALSQDRIKKLIDDK